MPEEASPFDLSKTIAALNDPDQRLAAIDALGASRDLRAGAALIGSLSSYRGDVRARAARALVTVPDPAARAPLAARVKSDTFGAVAVWALVALEAQGAPIPTDVVGHAFRTRQGIAHWSARLVIDMRRPEMREMARAAFEALGPEALGGVADALLARSTQADALEQIELADAVAAVLAQRVLARAPDAARAGRWLAASGRPWAERALEAAVFGDGDLLAREAALVHVASVTAGPRMYWARSVLDRAVGGDEPALARVAARLLRERGALVRAPHGALLESAVLRNGRGVLSPPLPEAGLRTLALAIARRMGISDELSPPTQRKEEWPAPRPGWTAGRVVTQWHLGPMTLSRMEDGEEHPHEGGGSVVTVFLRTPDADLTLHSGLSRYMVSGHGAAALEAHLVAAMDELGWSATPWLPWAGGRVMLDPGRARVYFDSPERAWHVDLDASWSMWTFASSRAEVVGSLLLVWTDCEHEKGGGGAYLIRLHRLREDGTVAWMCEVDHDGKFPHRARMTERGLEVLGNWRATDGSVTWRVLDPETGRAR